MTYETFSNHLKKTVKDVRDNAFLCQLNIEHISINDPIAHVLYKKLSDYADSYIANLEWESDEEDMLDYAIDRLLSIREEFATEAVEAVRIAKMENIDND